MIRVLIADDLKLVRQGIQALLKKDKEIEVIGEAKDGAEAVEMVKRLSPDILLMDLSMPGMNGNTATVKLREMHAPTRIIIVSMYLDEILVREVVRNGARGYLLKQSSHEELLAAIHAVYEGRMFFSPAVSKMLPTNLMQ